MTVLFVRAVIALLVLPGIVAGLVPWLMAGARSPSRPFNLLGLVPITAGAILLLWCVAAFYLEGRGTLAPWDPPRHLVVSGPYRFSRNPMYVAVALILCGWALGLRSRPHAVYAAVVLLAFHLRVVLVEEPSLGGRFGEEWTQYAAQVPRWVVF